MANPFNEQRQQQLKDDALEFLKEFGINYLTCFGLAMFNKIKAELEEEPRDDGLKLTYREFKSCERPSMFKGAVYMKKGGGPGDFGKWKKVYLVERQDYNIDVFADEKAFKGGKKASSTIHVAGYKLVRDVTWHYKWAMRHLAAGLGLTDAETLLMCSYSNYSWALSHDWRENYIFQLHQGKNPACPCFGGNAIEPEDVGSENAKERNEWIEFMGRCSHNACPRDTDSVKGQGFDLTVDKMKGSVHRLFWFRDDGTESEMLVDMLMAQCMPPLRDGMLDDLKGPVSMRLIAWYKTRVVIQGVLQKILDPAWAQMQKGADAAAEKIEPVLRQGLEPIFGVKKDVKNKIREAVVDKMGEFLGKTVTPFIDPIIKAFNKPLAEGFDHGASSFDKYVDVGSLPDDAKQRNKVLDNIPRTWSNVHDMRQASYDVVEPLRLVKKLNDDLFEGLQPYDLRNEAEDSLLRTLDAAVYTLQLRIDAQGKDPALKAQILADFKNDAQVAKAAFIKQVLRAVLLTGFKKAVSPITDPIIDGFNSVIPEPMHDFLSVQALFDEIIDLFVGEPIDKMVDAAFPKP